MSTVVQIVIVILVTVSTEFLVYKHMRRIDKKERKRLQKWEYDYVEELETKIKNLQKGKQ